MKNQRLPLPFCGVILALAALGNLLRDYGEYLRIICGTLSALALLWMLLSLVSKPKAYLKDMDDFVTASVSATLPMALLLLSGYIAPSLPCLALCLWCFALIMHAGLIVYFSLHFLPSLKLKGLHASIFIVYVGIACAAISAKAFSLQAVGRGIFYFALVSALVLLPLVIYRYAKLPPPPERAKPLFIILTAPISLCLVAYLQSFDNKSTVFVALMLFLALCLYIICLVKLASLLRLPFYPSFSAFTFPLVISAIAAKQSALLLAQGTLPNIAAVITLLQALLAALAVIYVLIRYLRSYLL